MSQPPDFDDERPAPSFGWDEWPAPDESGFPWPMPTADWEPPRRSRVGSTARLTAALLVSVAFVLAGVAAGVAVTSHPPLATSQTGAQLPNGPISARDLGIVDVNTVLAYQQARAAGTGMVLTSSGDVLTNNHVVEGATSIEVTVVVTGRTYRASVLGTDPTDDVAVLHLVGATGLRTAVFGTSSTLQVGESVTALGNAGGVGGLPSVSHGYVSALDQQITAGTNNGDNPSTERLHDMVQTTASLVPGDSGGPLLDGHDRVVGMDTAAGGANLDDATQNFAIPIDRALSIARLIEAGRATSSVHVGPTPFLGVEIDPQSTGGAMVEAVLPGTPASTTSLGDNDLIISVGTASVDSGDDLSGVLEQLRVGQSVRVVWTTPDGNTRSATVVLVGGPTA